MSLYTNDHKRRIRRVGIATLALIISGVAFGGPGLTEIDAAVATPGTPTVPQQPEVLYEEDFENRSPGSVTLLADYVGETGQTYTADPVWTNTRMCNGFVLDNTTQWSTGLCDFLGEEAAQNSFVTLRDMVAVIGQAAGNPVPESNAALAAMTEGNPGGNKMMFQTETPIQLTEPSPSGPVAVTDRFITFSVDAVAANCWYNHPLYRFSISGAFGSYNLTPTSLDTCTLPNTFIRNGNEFKAGTLVSGGSFLVRDQSFNINMTNAQGLGGGNDGAIDNIRVLDVTPQLDKSFSPTSVPVGETSTLTLTITNTSELNAKTGWAFTDNLPTGLVLAQEPGVTTTCGDTTTVSAPSGGSAIAVTNGSLAQGATHCTISVKVTSQSPRGAEASPRLYSNGPSNMSGPGVNGGMVGMRSPNTATVEFYSTPALKLEKTSDGSASSRVGDTVTYTVEATNTGTGDFSATNPAVVIDDLSGVLDDAEAPQNITATVGGTPVAAPSYQQPLIAWSGPLAAGQKVVITYTVDLKAGGNRTVKNVAFPSGTPFDPQNPPATPACGVDGAVCTEFPLTLLGSITWEKVSPAPQSEPLAGSQWSLVPLDGNGVEVAASAIQIVDCVETSAAACTTGDVNPVAGELQVRDLGLGVYHLYETQAPAGYRLLTDHIVVILDEASLDAQGNLSLGAIENTKQGVPELPRTGGAGQTALIAGGLGLVAAGVGAMAIRRRKASV